MAWNPIMRLRGTGASDVRPHPRDAALLVAVMKVSASAPAEWVQHFLHPPGSWRVVEGLNLAGVEITCPFGSDGELADLVKEVDLRIDAANRAYERDELPEQRRREDREAKAQAAQEQRLASTKAKLGDL